MWVILRHTKSKEEKSKLLRFSCLVLPTNKFPLNSPIVKHQTRKQNGIKIYFKGKG
jgi:hypothetical protein